MADLDKTAGDPQDIAAQLKKVETEITDLKARWPAHSIKPAMIFELEELEEERDRLQALLKGQA